MTSDTNLTEIKEASELVTIDARAAEQLAKSFDYEGRDLKINIDMDFGAETAMNFVTVDPILFSTSAYVEVLDVATANDDEEYETVEGFQDQNFDKILTAEANKFVTDEVVKKTLAPSNFSYQGLGVFSFPVRIAKKIRVTLLMRDPIPNFYERLYVLTQQITRTTTQTTSSKKGL